VSEEEIKDQAEVGGEESVTTPLPQGVEVIINKKTNELIIKDPTGRTATIKATVIEEEEGQEDEDDAEVLPLTQEQFRDALQRLADLGLTWTADRLPHVRAKTKEADQSLLSPEFEQIQQEYPTLPRELSAIAFHHFTGTPVAENIVGGEDDLKRKVDIAREFYLDDDYRSEFFFKHAIKVPYFSDIDWEVVIKGYEKNVQKFAGVAYALLSLRVDNPDFSGQKLQPRNITVAVDTARVDRLLEILGEVKEALDAARALTSVLHQLPSSEESKDANANNETEKSA
jgi:hypothetical protein